MKNKNSETPVDGAVANFDVLYRRDHPGNRCSYGIAGNSGIIVFDKGLFKDGVAPASITLNCEMAAPKMAAEKVDKAAAAAAKAQEKADKAAAKLVASTAKAAERQAKADAALAKAKEKADTAAAAAAATPATPAE